MVQDGAEPFGLGSLVEVWGEPYHPDDDNPVFDFRVCTPRPGVVTGRSDFDIVVKHDLSATADADLVCLAPKEKFEDHDPAVIEAVRAAYDRGAIIYAHCSGVFELGAAGLLDDRECTTHWRYTDLLAAKYPKARVRPDVLYCHEGNVLTGAGSAAGLDASLHLLRENFGANVAATTARRIVVPPHRDGGQAQYIDRPVRGTCDDDAIARVLTWLQEHLDEDATVEQLAARAHLAPRTFARRFQQETGTTPYQWLLGQRLLLAQQLLEETDATVDTIASRAGFGNAATLRHHFLRRLDTTPNAYRRTFRGPAVGAGR